MQKNGAQFNLEAVDLLDDFERVGTNVQDFHKILDAIDRATFRLDVEIPEMAFAALTSENSNEDKIYRLIDANDMVNNAKRQYRRFAKEDIEKIEPAIIKEMEKYGCFILHNRKRYFMSRNVFSGLAVRAGFTGPAVLKPTANKFLAYLEECIDTNASATFMGRSAEGVSKLVSCSSQKYNYQPLAILKTIAELFDTELGVSECRTWKVDNFFASVEYDFPEVGKDLAKTYGFPDTVIPGIRLCTSDAGESSIIAEGTMRIGKNNAFYTESFTRKHIGNYTLDDVLQGVEKNVFQKYTKLPSRLAELLLINVEDPGYVVEKVLKSLKFEEDFGKRIMAKVIPQLIAEFDPAMKYTAYNIAVSLMSLPDRLVIASKSGSTKETAESTIDKLRRNIQKVAFADYEKFSAGAPSVVLTA